MNIIVKANNKVNTIKKIKIVLLEIKEKNIEYKNKGVVIELAQSIEQIVNGMTKTADNQYIANVIFYSKPLYYNYHGLVQEPSSMNR